MWVRGGRGPEERGYSCPLGSPVGTASVVKLELLVRINLNRLSKACETRHQVRIVEGGGAPEMLGKTSDEGSETLPMCNESVSAPSVPAPIYPTNELLHRDSAIEFLFCLLTDTPRRTGASEVSPRLPVQRISPQLIGFFPPREDPVIADLVASLTFETSFFL